MPKLMIDVDEKINERLKLTSQILRLKQEDVIRNILAKGSEDEINNLLNELTTLYANNVLNENELERILGKNLVMKIKKLKTVTEKGFEDVKRWVK